jgi:hypothetical protein
LNNAHMPSLDVFVITNPTAQRHLARQLLLEEIWREAPQRVKA